MLHTVMIEQAAHRYHPLLQNQALLIIFLGHDVLLKYAQLIHMALNNQLDF